MTQSTPHSPPTLPLPTPPDRRGDRPFTAYPWQVAGIGVLTVVAGLLLTQLTLAVARPLALIFIALVIGEALSPIVTLVERWAPRVAAVIIVYVGLLLVIAGIGWLIFPPLVGQAAETITDGPGIAEQVRDLLDSLGIPQSDRIVSTAQARLSDVGGALVNLPLAIVSGAAEIVIVFFLSLYWLLTVRSLRAFVLSLIPERHHPYAEETFRELSRMMGGYVRAAAIQGLIIGAVSYIGLRLIGVQFPVILAVIAGVTEMIPVVGPLIAMIPILGVALLSSPTTALITLGFWIGLQQFENHVLTPGIMRSQTNLPPFLVLVALFIGGGTAGIVAAFVAIPLAGVLKVLVVRLLAPWIRSLAAARDEPERGRAEAETG